MSNPVSQALVIFGASGDLTKRKLLPSIYQLFIQNSLPKKFLLLGASRTAFSDLEFREKMMEFLPQDNPKKLEEFLEFLHYEPIQTDNEKDYYKLKERLESLCKEKEVENNYIFYLSTPPSLYSIIPKHLATVGLNREESHFRRLIVEKPFGTDLESAIYLNKELIKYFEEQQIYRIDHYLGKETVQNLLVLRFANAIFEPIWNRNFIDRVEITSAESLGVENRGGYYEKSGALRDMIQNHLLQLVGLVAMEPPVEVEADTIRNEVLKVFKAFKPFSSDEDIAKNVIRGQYTASNIKGKPTKGYRDEVGVAPDSRTETFAALKFYINNWRWSNVPFYIRTGKRLPTRVTEVVIHFKNSPHHLFSGGKELPQIHNQLIIRIQPDEGILMKFGMKEPGAGFVTQPVNMDFHYNTLTDKQLPSAYQRLLLDCMIGDATLYSRGDTVLEAWKFVKPIQDYWMKEEAPIYGYPAGTWGPYEADELIEGEEQTWRYPCKNLSNDGLYCEL
ncbi:glucose-6-phosphate dehydrogenase [Halosquirtibacter xylanolyticus]|uniref:glucose-6-phosphate dehydrogenase n=1 Tax=Halosquirtibacter xylanolyticus TaxID=3374599 RepID=UPI00374A21C7|nr:glucose-6-phosphate dehydrogenase [Prolixibacteraceae bacterium]